MPEALPVVRIDAGALMLHEAGRTRGRADALLDVADNLARVRTGRDVETLEYELRRRAGELASESEARVEAYLARFGPRAGWRSRLMARAARLFAALRRWYMSARG